MEPLHHTHSQNVQALFGNLGSHKLAPAMETRIDFLTAAAPDAPAQLAQLLALEWLLGVGMPEKLKEAPLAIKVLYDEDIAEEVCLDDEPAGYQISDFLEITSYSSAVIGTQALGLSQE